MLQFLLKIVYLNHQHLLIKHYHFVKLAQAFGAKGFKATDKESFEEAFKKAYKVKGPAIIDLTIKTDSLVLPMLKPGGTFNNLILRREDISDAEK